MNAKWHVIGRRVFRLPCSNESLEYDEIWFLRIIRTYQIGRSPRQMSLFPSRIEPHSGQYTRAVRTRLTNRQVRGGLSMNHHTYEGVQLFTPYNSRTLGPHLVIWLAGGADSSYIYSGMISNNVAHCTTLHLHVQIFL